MITALGGGVGASKFLRGLRGAIGEEHLTVVVNTADDITLHGLRISPDIDTVIYWLSGAVDRERGWGQSGDTFRGLTALDRLGLDTWFRLGDLDLATHIFRSSLREEGRTPTEITRRIAEAFELNNTTVIPMTDSDVETWIETDKGWMHFQEYFVKERMRPLVKGVEFRGSENASAPRGVMDALRQARGVVICPSNPIISIGPILSIRGMRQALGESGVRVAAVSPIIGGKALKGPAVKLMEGLGLEPSSAQVAELYGDFLHTMVIDEADSAQRERIESLGIKVLVTDTIMTDDERAVRLAEKTLSVFR